MDNGSTWERIHDQKSTSLDRRSAINTPWVHETNGSFQLLTVTKGGLGAEGLLRNFLFNYIRVH
jgi:hypothetical protein